MSREDLQNISGEIVESSKRSGWKKTLWIGFILLLLIGGSIAGVLMYAVQALKPVNPSEDVVTFTVEKGMNSSQISKLLEENGLIKDSRIFNIYLRYKGEGSLFQAGTYEMQPGITKEEIISRLNNGDVKPEETYSITVPEGYTIEQIAVLLEAFETGHSSLFLQRMKDPDPWLEELQFEAATEEKQEKMDQLKQFISEIPDSDLYRYKLEGYMFPETYAFALDATEDEISRRMLLELANKLESLPDGWEQQLEELNISFHEMMTIASLIERETMVDEERAKVASVIYNRLAIDMPLQIDATVQYLLAQQKEQLYESDLQIESPYNTYQNTDLPPGPIASPGLESIKAALYPENTEYLFYVTKKDGTNTHYFSETYEEHLQYKRISEAEG